MGFIWALPRVLRGFFTEEDADFPVAALLGASSCFCGVWLVRLRVWIVIVGCKNARDLTVTRGGLENERLVERSIKSSSDTLINDRDKS
jgi:hypothetical protein